MEHQIFRFAKMILRDRCSTSCDLASLFRGKCTTLDRWNGKKRKTHWHEAVSYALTKENKEDKLGDKASGRRTHHPTKAHI